MSTLIIRGEPVASTPDFAAWSLVESAARGGLYQAIRQRRVGLVDLDVSENYLRSRTAELQFPWRHRDMLLKLIGEAKRLLRQRPDLAAPPSVSGLGLIGEIAGLHGVFDAIWSGIKWGAGQLATGVQKVFKAGQTAQATSVEVQKKAEQISADIAATVNQVKSVTGEITTEVAAAQVKGGVEGFLRTDVGKVVLYGGLAVLAVMLLSGGQRSNRRRR